MESIFSFIAILVWMCYLMFLKGAFGHKTLSTLLKRSKIVLLLWWVHSNVNYLLIVLPSQINDLSPVWMARMWAWTLTNFENRFGHMEHWCISFNSSGKWTDSWRFSFVIEPNRLGHFVQPNGFSSSGWFSRMCSSNNRLFSMLLLQTGQLQIQKKFKLSWIGYKFQSSCNLLVLLVFGYGGFFPFSPRCNI